MTPMSTPLIHRAATGGEHTICRQNASEVHVVDVMNPDAVTCPVCAAHATPSSDPAHFLLTDGHTTTPKVHRRGCYICEDPEFAQMGLPLCTPCPDCSAKHSVIAGHIAADDTVCDDCGYDTYPYPEEAGEDGTPVITHVPSPPVTDVIADLGDFR